MSSATWKTGLKEFVSGLQSCALQLDELFMISLITGRFPYRMYRMKFRPQKQEEYKIRAVPPYGEDGPC